MNQSDTPGADLSRDDLQRSPEQDPAHHRDSSAALQEAIAEVVSTCGGWPVEDAIQALNTALTKRGQPEQPASWIEAVARGAVEGRTYVVSQAALDVTGIEVPAHDLVEESTGRDRGHDPA